MFMGPRLEEYYAGMFAMGNSKMPVKQIAKRAYDLAKEMKVLAEKEKAVQHQKYKEKELFREKYNKAVSEEKNLQKLKKVFNAAHREVNNNKYGTTEYEKALEKRTIAEKAWGQAGREFKAKYLKRRKKPEDYLD